jgi:hypothetical protein
MRFGLDEPLPHPLKPHRQLQVHLAVGEVVLSDSALHKRSLSDNLLL